MRDLEPKSLATRSTETARLQASAVSRHSPRILIIEDELLIALMIEEIVRESGYRVSGVAHTIPMAAKEFAKRNYDAVLLDINIGGRFHAHTADHLVSRGIPFAFVTGYDYLVDPRHEKIPVLQKPFAPAHLRALLETLVGPGALARANGS
jgi:DNA-binding response OmpR family regulator